VAIFDRLSPNDAVAAHDALLKVMQERLATVDVLQHFQLHWVEKLGDEAQILALGGLPKRVQITHRKVYEVVDDLLLVN